MGEFFPKLNLLCFLRENFFYLRKSTVVMNRGRGEQGC
jgi:hypothetical protein